MNAQMNLQDIQFGCKPSPKDGRDFPLTSFIPLGTNLTLEGEDEMYWLFRGTTLHQNTTKHCTGFMAADFRINDPVFNNCTNQDGHNYYYLAKELEGDPGGEDGAYMRSAAKALLSLKQIEAYAFATTIEQIKYWLIHKGCLMIGTAWMSGMMKPDSNNIIHATGTMEGYHASLAKAWRIDNMIGIKNSWGDDWGLHGEAWISVDDFEKLRGTYIEAITAVDLEDIVAPPPQPPVPVDPLKGCSPLSGITRYIKTLLENDD